MLAEIFMLRLEALARETPADKPTMEVSTRFVPLSPRAGDLSNQALKSGQPAANAAR